MLPNMMPSMETKMSLIKGNYLNLPKANGNYNGSLKYKCQSLKVK